MGSQTGTGKMARPEQLEQLFKEHLREHHHIETSAGFKEEDIQSHLEGRETLLPVTIFLDSRLSALETIVKYLRENEGLPNAAIAKLLGRTTTNIWLTYRNAAEKVRKRLTIEDTDIYVPTSIFHSELSVLEAITDHLISRGMSYAEIGRRLSRNERTIWTVVQRARRKLAR